MSTLNINPTSNIPFGLVTAAVLDSEIVHILIHGQHVSDHNYRVWLEEKAVRDVELEAHGMQVNRFEEYANSANLCVSGTYDGVQYQSTTQDGRLSFFIMESPVITHKAIAAGAGAPNCGILAKGMNGSTTSYSVPIEWWADFI